MACIVLVLAYSSFDMHVCTSVFGGAVSQAVLDLVLVVVESTMDTSRSPSFLYFLAIPMLSNYIIAARFDPWVAMFRTCACAASVV